MITDKLLAFADNAALTPDETTGKACLPSSDGIDLGKGTDEIARTLNLVCQIDAFGSGDTGTDVIEATLQGYDGTDWAEVVKFPGATVAEAKAGKRIIPFAKLPLGMAKYSKLRLEIAVHDGTHTPSTLATGAKCSAWLTPSAELEYEKH